MPTLEAILAMRFRTARELARTMLNEEVMQQQVALVVTIDNSKPDQAT